jgi:hypothetical protein
LLAAKAFLTTSLQAKRNNARHTFWQLSRAIVLVPSCKLTSAELRHNIPANGQIRPNHCADHIASTYRRKACQKEEVVMDLLVTVIGNAVVDPLFRRELLADPRLAIDTWGFRLTKGEVEMLEAMFTDRQMELREEFAGLEEVLYKNLEKLILTPCDRPCRMSISRPLTLKKAA